MFKNIFKNKDKMATKNTEIDENLNSTALENNENGEQVKVEELSTEEQLTQDLANERDKHLRLFAESKILSSLA